MNKFKISSFIWIKKIIIAQKKCYSILNSNNKYNTSIRFSVILKLFLTFNFSFGPSSLESKQKTKTTLVPSKRCCWIKTTTNMPVSFLSSKNDI